MESEKEKQCPLGCKCFTGGEVRHIKECPHYPESLSQLLDTQNEMIGDLTVRNKMLSDSESARSWWLSKAKQDAGFPDRVSFDEVWALALFAYKNQLTTNPT